MVYKILALIVGFYFLAIFQTSFFPNLSILGATPNLVLSLICLVAFFERKNSYSGILGALAGGLFIDLLANSFIGAATLGCVLIYILLKEVLKQLHDMPRSYSLLYFLPILAASVVFYDFLLSLFYYSGSLATLLNVNILATLFRVLYTLAFGAVGFYIFKTFSPRLNEPK